MTNETMKRSLEDSDSDDGLDQEPGSPEQNCRKSDRKRRRGIVEKRRRDRINQSLGELRRLVPAAFEKQGSAKLEKAEILQMAVDHLKMLHAKGLNGYSMDTAALAMDYRSVGFRECAAEVARYMVSVEGMDIQDPLRLRLMSHLQCYSAQRDVASKASLQSFQHNPWNMAAAASAAHPATFNAQYNGNSFGAFTTHGQTGSALAAAAPVAPNSSGLPAGSYPEPSRPAVPSHQQTAPGSLTVTSSTTSSLHSSGQVATHALSGLSQMHAQLPVSLSNGLPSLSPTAAAHYNALGQSGNAKPYRPWGAELAY